MKRLISFCVLLVIPALIAACGGGNSSSNDVATTPLTNNCLDGSTYCNGSIYNQYNQYGFQSYPGNGYNTYNYYGSYNNSMYNAYNNYYGHNYPNNNYNARFCDCPQGTMPVYNNQIGMGCVNRQVIAPVAGFAGYYQLSAANSQWINVPQITGVGAGAGSQSSCYQNVANACFLNTPNQCGGGFRCQPSSAGSAMGVCIRNQ